MTQIQTPVENQNDNAQQMQEDRAAQQQQVIEAAREAYNASVRPCFASKRDDPNAVLDRQILQQLFNEDAGKISLDGKSENETVEYLVGNFSERIEDIAEKLKERLVNRARAIAVVCNRSVTFKGGQTGVQAAKALLNPKISRTEQDGYWRNAQVS